MFTNVQEHIVRSIEDLGIVEAENGEALRPQESIAPPVVESTGVPFVAVAVDFDDKASGEPGEVCNVWTDWSFPPKAGAQRT